MKCTTRYNHLKIQIIFNKYYIKSSVYLPMTGKFKKILYKGKI